jgi:two-component system sensor kinase FixL
VRHISHELIQPLTALVNYVEVGKSQLEQAGPGLDSRRPLFDQMQRHADEAVAAIQRLRSAPNGFRGPHEPFDVNASVREAVEIMDREARPHNIKVSLDLFSKLPTVKGDRFELTQAIVEILRNSFEAIQEAAGERREVAVYTGLSDEGQIEVRIEDTGTAISGAEMGRLFEPFYTTKPVSLGLGLAAAHSAVEACGGDIVARPNDDLGMTILVRIPTEEDANIKATVE